MSYEPTTWANGDIITATKLNNIESGVQSVSNSYTPTTWVTGDIITATKLNNIEQGIANAGGGSSDFSTATVTLNPTAPSGYEITWWSVSELSIPSYTGERTEIYRMIEMVSETSNQFNILLYQGVGYLGGFAIYDGTHDVGLYVDNPTLSENITLDSETGKYVITGDCTISGLAEVE